MDAADAEAICEAVGHPDMRFVLIRTIESQGALTLHRVRSLLVRQRTATVNAAHGLLGEVGIVAAKGIRRVDDLRRDMAMTRESTLPREARTTLDALFDQLDALTGKLGAVDREILAGVQDKRGEPAPRHGARRRPADGGGLDRSGGGCLPIHTLAPFRSAARINAARIGKR